MFSHSRTVPLKFEGAVDKVTLELKKQGFGIITRIDVRQTMKEKLGLDLDDHVILGACNPGFAHKALLAEEDIGLLLPCNVTVRDKGGDTIVSTILPETAMSFIENEKIAKIAKAAQSRLVEAIDSV